MVFSSLFTPLPSPMTPWRYHALIAVPNWDQFKEEPGELRVGINAAHSTYALAEIAAKYHLAHLTGREQREAMHLVENTRREYPAFQLLESIVNGMKHLKVKLGYRSEMFAASAGTAVVGKMGYVVVDEDADGSTIERECIEDRVIIHASGGPQDLNLAVDEIMTLWAQHPLIRQP